MKRLPGINDSFQYRIQDDDNATPQMLDDVELTTYLNQQSHQKNIHVVDMFPDLQHPFGSTLNAIIERDLWARSLTRELERSQNA